MTTICEYGLVIAPKNEGLRKFLLLMKYLYISDNNISNFNSDIKFVKTKNNAILQECAIAPYSFDMKDILSKANLRFKF